jgi:hypothetical protein
MAKYSGGTPQDSSEDEFDLDSREREEREPPLQTRGLQSPSLKWIPSPEPLNTATEIDKALFNSHADAPTGAPPRRGAGRYHTDATRLINTKPTISDDLQNFKAEKSALLPGAVTPREVDRRRRTSLLDELSLSAQSLETYTITVMTGGESGAGNSLAGTDANIYICLIGEKIGYRTGDVWLNHHNLISDKQNTFEDGSRDVFEVMTRDIGELKKVR